MPKPMQYAVILPGGDAPTQLEQAELAERSGWDGVFVWEAAYGVAAWPLLAAMAARTERVRLGTLLTPLPFRRPWKVASEVATVDQLSGGRAILAVGVGAVDESLPRTNDDTDLRLRAEQLDEGIDLVRGLWEGQGHFAGQHYRFDLERDELLQVCRPLQPRLPIWVVGVWPRPKSMRRVLRCDGIVPQYSAPEGGEGEGRPEDLRAVRDWLQEHGASPDLDVISEGETPGDDPGTARQQVAPWAEAGATWWLETRWEMPHNGADRMRQIRDRIAAGPPRVAWPAALSGGGRPPAGDR